jgi:hypothetical protein
MQTLTATQLLAVWEQGADQPPVQRGLLLLCAACPDESPTDLAGLNIGERDSRLFSLRERIFGPSLSSITACPACGTQLEMNFQTSDLRVAPAQAGQQGFAFSQDGYRVTYRLPNSLDLISAAASSTPQGGRHLLIEQCLLGTLYQEQAVKLEQIPVAVIDGVIEAMQEADPLADINLNLSCQTCGNSWLAPFDILAYLWSEIDSWAYRTLQEVHRLAQAYGWTEAEILFLSARRRQFYLAMV